MHIYTCACRAVVIYSQWLYIVLEHSRSPTSPHKMITHRIDDLSQQHTGTVFLDYLLL